MIIVRAPLRIPLGGGGTDVPSYYHRFGGFILAAAIAKYVYVALHKTFKPGIILKYSKMETAETADGIKHPIIREALKLIGIEDPHLEITSMSDIPAGTGLGSSGSFTVALLQALHQYKGDCVPPLETAREACHIEMDILGEPVGKQDPYIAATGGVRCFDFSQDDELTVFPLDVAPSDLQDLEDNTVMVYTGVTRSASAVLSDQDTRTRNGDKEMLNNLHRVKELGYDVRDALENGDLRQYANLLSSQWQNKQRRSANMSTPEIDRICQFALKNGALGGKLVGAGGGGFLMFYTEEGARLRRALRREGLRDVRVRFDYEGVKTLVCT